MFKYIYFFFLIFQLAYSNIISEKGKGKTEQLAKENAVQNLSKSLKVNIDIEEELVTVQSGDKKENTTYKNKIQLKSELIILGLKYKNLPKEGNEYVVEAYLDSEGLEEQISQLQKEKEEIRKNLEDFSKNRSFNSQKDSLKQALKALDKFEKMFVVYEAIKKETSNLELGEITINLNGNSRKIRVNKSSLQSLEREVENLLKNNLVALVVEEDKKKLTELMYEYTQYLNDINNKIIVKERESASKIIKVKVIDNNSEISFKYFVVNLKTGVESEFLKSKKNYKMIELGFVEDLLHNLDVINKKIGELSDGK